MPTANELLRDATISHQVDLAQYSAQVVRRMIGILNQTDADLVAALLAALERLDPDSFTVERLELVLQSVRAVNAAAYERVQKALTEELRQFAAVEVDAQLSLIEQSVPTQVAQAYSFVRVDPAQVYAAAMARPFQGRLLRQWFEDLKDARVQKRLRDVIAIGYTSGKPTDQIVREIKGTKANRYMDGFLNRDRQQLRTVVHSAIQHLAANVNEATALENSDIVKGRQWLSTLDTKTTEMCRIRDGRQYTNEEHPKPIGHRIPWLAGPAKIHWGCRSTFKYTLKSLAEITGLDLPDATPGTRASMDGQVPADTTYSEWIQRQSAERQDEVVGPTRGKLMRAGKLPFDAFYTNRGEYLTLDELRERHARAFERAGL